MRRYRSRKSVIFIVLCTLAGIMLLTWFVLLLCRGASVRKLNRVTDGSTDAVIEQRFVEIGGQRQYFLIRGKNRNNPVVLWLHGGPGSPDSMFNYEFTKYLENDFTFVSWDRRGAGRTYYANRKSDALNESVNFERALDDLDEAVNYLCSEFSRDKIIIAAHSFGTLLGARYCVEHGEKVSKYVAVSQLVDYRRSEEFAFYDAVNAAKISGSKYDSLQLAYDSFKENPTVESNMKLRRCLSKFHKTPSLNLLKLITLSPDANKTDLRWGILQSVNTMKLFSLEKELFDVCMNTTISDLGNRFLMPVAFVSGKKDWITPMELVQEYYSTIRSPDKKFYLMDGCGHNPQIEKSEYFAEVLEKILSE